MSELESVEKICALTSERDRLARQLATVTKQLERAHAALRYAVDPNHRDDLLRKHHSQAIKEARESGDG